MPLQEFVPGDKVAYLVETATGLKACCGTVAAAETFTKEGCTVTINKRAALFVHEDDGSSRVMEPSKVDYFDGYTAGRKKRIKYTQSDEIIKLKEKAQEVDKQFAQLAASHAETREISAFRNREIDQLKLYSHCMYDELTEKTNEVDKQKAKHKEIMKACRKDYYEICKEASAKERAYRSVIDENRRQVRIIEHLKKKGVPCCVVCMDADAKVSFVHGSTAHLATCAACAVKHFRRSDQRDIRD